MQGSSVSFMFSMINKASICNIGDVNIPTSKKCLNLLELLYREGFIRGYTYNKTLTTIYIKFIGSSKKPVIKHIQTVSTTGRKIFVNTTILSKLINSQETFIISTRKGLLTTKEALKKNVGGIVFCKLI